MVKNKNLSFALGLGLAFAGAVTGAGLLSGNASALVAQYCDETTRVCEVDEFSEMLEVFDDFYDEDAEELTVRLVGNIVQTTGEGDYLAVNTGRTMNLDLNGNTLQLRGDGTRGLMNYGNLNIYGGGTVSNGTDIDSAYGLIDNFGALVLDDVTMVDYGEGNGSSVKNRPSGNSSLLVKSNVEFIGNGENLGNAAIYSDGELVVEDGVRITTKSDRAYSLIVNTGTAVFGTPQGSSNPIVVSGVHGGLGVNGGSVVVNNGRFSCTNYYGIWITNNDGNTDVQINDGEFRGGLYGLRAGVDDGHQDSSNADIRIYDGKFYGETKGAVALNESGSEREWGLTIYGGEYSSLPAAGYIAEGKEIYDKGPDGPYFVDDDVTLPAYPETLFLEVGESYEVPHNEVMWKYATMGYVPGDVLTAQNWTVTGAQVGEAMINVNLHDYLTPSEANFGVKVWALDVDTETDGTEDVSEDDTEMVEGYVSEQVNKFLSGEEVDAGVIIYEGISVEHVKEKLAEGEKVVAVIGQEYYELDDNQVEDFLDWFLSDESEEDEVMTAGDVFAGAFWAGVELRLGDEAIGEVTMLEDGIEMMVAVGEDALTPPAEGFERKFYVIRKHYDPVTDEITYTRIPAELDGTNVKFVNSEFSEFVVVYQDVEIETGEVKTPETGTLTKENQGAVDKHINVVAAIAATVMTLIGMRMISVGVSRIKRENNLKK